jgi:hypothetical protein
MPIVHNLAIRDHLNASPMTPSPTPSNPDPAPRKRKITATARVRENADPLLPKNKKAKLAHTKATQKEVAPSSVTADSSDVEGVDLHAEDPSEIVEQAAVIVMDDSDTESESELDAAEESCEAELRKDHFNQVRSDYSYLS